MGVDGAGKTTTIKAIASILDYCLNILTFDLKSTLSKALVYLTFLLKDLEFSISTPSLFSVNFLFQLQRLKIQL